MPTAPDRSAEAALDAIGKLPDGEIDLAGAAVQLARVGAPGADWHAAQAHLSDLARDAAAFPAAADLPARAHSLAVLLSGRHEYAGDAETYDDAANANLIRVIERRRGLPVALGILWLHCARVAGWDAHGVDFPGHFLVALTRMRNPHGMGERRDGRQVVVDPFAGGLVLGAAELRALARRIEGPEAVLRPGLLRPMTPREVLLRLQNNLRMRRLQARDLPGALACLETMLRIAPEAASLWQDRALLHEALEQPAAAIWAWERFLRLVPTGEVADRARAAVGALRTQLN